ANCTNLRHCRNAEAPVDFRQIRPNRRTHQEMDGDGGRDESQWPTPSLTEYAQKHRWTIEPHAPAEDGERESTADDAPAVKDGRSGFRAIGQYRPQHCSHPASLPGENRNCYGDDRSVRMEEGVK